METTGIIGLKLNAAYIGVRLGIMENKLVTAVEKLSSLRNVQKSCKITPICFPGNAWRFQKVGVSLSVAIIKTGRTYQGTDRGTCL